ncbi:hypothetical protein TNCV_2489261 [Trichonephila clavipes]|nr:hypothetical protein TNCV_2489261 [Trichonephila clavipes]
MSRRIQMVTTSPVWSPMSPNWLPNMMPTWLYRQDLANFPLNHHFNIVGFHEAFRSSALVIVSSPSLPRSSPRAIVLFESRFTRYPRTALSDRWRSWHYVINEYRRYTICAHPFLHRPS